jgi:segregation and condensation protein B
MANFRTTTGWLLRSVASRYRPWRRFSGWSYTRVGSKRQLSWISRGESPPTGGGENVRDERLSHVEAVLFLAKQPVASRKLAELAGLADGTKARTLVRTLNRLYDAGGCAFRVEEVAGGFQLMTQAKFAPWLRRLHDGWVEVRLSAPAMETLAVVAYRQPILRAEIEAIRGVQSGEVLRQLIERDLVRIVGRSGELGRPYLYGTSKRFLQIFGLKHIEELPRPESLRGPASVAGQSKTQDDSSAGISKQPNYFPEAKEEKNVKTLTTTKAHSEEFTEESMAVLMEPNCCRLPNLQNPSGQYADEEQDYIDEDEEEDDDFDDFDDDEDDDEDDDDDEDEDLEEEEPWEEVDDEDELEDEDEDDDEDEDWDDDDWDDEDEDDWDDDDEDEDEEEDDEEDVE